MGRYAEKKLLTNVINYTKIKQEEQWSERDKEGILADKTWINK